MDPELFHKVVLIWTGLAPVVFVVLLFIAAPYGRHAWLGGPMLSGRAGWLVMESPAVVLMAALFILGRNRTDPAVWAFLILWELHYVHRAFVFPLRMRGRRKPMPLVTALMGSSFQVVNVGLVGLSLFFYAPAYGRDWLLDPRFLFGTVVFVTGFVVNFRADTILLNLRRPGEDGYRIPFGGMYRFVSCPNYLGEILEWFGFALATWSLPALSFGLWTAANLVPRAITNHKWYRAQFPDYPVERRAVLPFVL
jgi:steroid 5-alpha-reductase/3-oxo-5-alpha-steroid 4-dehydrogenase 1